MSENNYEALLGCGFDPKEALERFMNNQALLEKFLGKFLEDPTYSALCGAMERSDSAEAFRCVHTIKGVAGNLALHGLYDAACRLTETLRGAQSMEQAEQRGAGAAFDALCKQYTDTCDAIKSCIER
ncbi:Hpt domain-containing protein [Allofournierella sp.]|uniref:Hpt domain-containing protein n=1 Tax=Allofournierella sp. TaxID=1940256 RepID=UPI003AB46FAA